jgi:hypothetical protein
MLGDAGRLSERVSECIILRTPRGKARGNSSRPTSSGSAREHTNIQLRPMESLERQADSLILAVQPSEASTALRESVFKFIEKLIRDCFSETTVSIPSCFSYRFSLCPLLHCCRPAAMSVPPHLHNIRLPRVPHLRTSLL